MRDWIAPTPQSDIELTVKTFLLTAAAMLAFAGNSLLCRQALEHTGIDAASFTTIRIISGAVTLWTMSTVRGNYHVWQSGSWISAIALTVYAACFSFAYLDLTAATGALLLFTAVQATMLGYGYFKGERLGRLQVFALFIAFCGFVALLYPGFTSPPLIGALLMCASGCAWGVYSLRSGRADPLATTAANFVFAAPISVVILIVAAPQVTLDLNGVALAIASGAVTSGCGYAIWYAALRGLAVTSAATIQLSVPVITAAAAVLTLGEPIVLRFAIASVAILGGVAVVIRTRSA